MLDSLEGLDHVVVMVEDLDRAAEDWRSLGFTLSPRGTHSAHLGTGNYTIMFDADYVELLAVLQETPLNEASRAFLKRHGEGIERAAFTSRDAAAGVRALQARGVAATGPIEFGRPVELPDGSQARAEFSVFHWPVAEQPGGMRIFACQHRTRGSVWIPSLQRHANTAHRILRLEVLAANPAQAGRQLADLIDGEVRVDDAGLARVASAPGRGEFVFMTQAAFRARHGAAVREALPEQGVAALVLGMSDAAAAARAVGSRGISGIGGQGPLTVPASNANGVLLVFEAS
jgi:hypothetical protein